MADYKEKIRNDARGFAGGVLNDTSGLINEKSAEIQKKIEAGLGMASSRLAQTGTDLQTGRGTEADQARRRQKLLKKRAELDEKYGEKIAELTREGKSDKLAETQEKYREEVAKIEAKLTELDAVS